MPVLIVRRADRRVLYASQPFLELMRVTPNGCEQLDQRRPVRPGRGERLRGRDAARRARWCENHEITVRRSDGSVFPAAITARPVEYEGEDAAVFGVVDLTEQKKAEAEIVRQREALHQSEKLNALGSLLANVAHELNNPLSVVVGYATMLRDMAPDEATRQRASQGARRRRALRAHRQDLPDHGAAQARGVGAGTHQSDHRERARCRRLRSARRRHRGRSRPGVRSARRSPAMPIS